MGDEENAVEACVKADLRRASPVTEWRAWLNNLYEKLKRTRKGREHMRLGSGTIKRIKEEVEPVIRLAESQFPSGSTTYLRFRVDNGPVDAFLRCPSGTEIPIQVTRAFRHEDRLRLELVHAQGYAPGSGPIKRVGKSSVIAADWATYSLEERVNELSELLENTMEAKRRCVTSNTWFVIYFNDAIPPEGLKDIIERCSTAAQNLPYAATFLVGSTETSRCYLLAGST
jgi:hypothetical protein